MAGLIRSADKAYYASKQPLLLRGTREGRSNPTTAPSYKQKANDVTASSSKYYAEMPATQVPVANRAGQQVKSTFQPEKLATLPAKGKILPDVVAAFQQGATAVRIEGPAADINKSRAAIEMAVGRKTLTRAQADRVVFVSVVPPAPVRAKTKDEPSSGIPEAEAILNPPKAEEESHEHDLLNSKLAGPKKKRNRKSTNKQDEPAAETDGESERGADLVDESDIAAAFGVDASAADPSDDDDSYD
jgi:hypothetical protein